MVDILATYAGLEDGQSFQETVYLLGDFNVCPYKNIFPKDGYLKTNSLNSIFLDFLNTVYANEPHFSEYDYLIFTLTKSFTGSGKDNEVRDLLLEKFKHHPVTYVDSIHQDMLPEQLHLVENRYSMDFVFNIQVHSVTESNAKLKVDQQSVRVSYFNYDNKPFKYLSDHLAVDFSFQSL